MLQSLVTDVFDGHAPLKTKTLKKPSAPFMHSKLRKDIFKKCQLRNKNYKFKGDRNWDRFRKQRNYVNKFKHKSRNVYLTNKFNGDMSSKDFWNTVKPFLTDKMIDRGTSIILKDDDRIITDEEEVCNIFNDFFSNAAKDIGYNDVLPNDVSPENIRSIVSMHSNHPSIQNINDMLKEPSETSLSISNVSQEHIENLMKKIDIHKSTGFDNLPPKLIKLANTFLAPHITSLINQSIDSCTFPQTLKCAEVSPVYKKEDNMMRENYRPISILSIFSKLFETVYCVQLTEIFDKLFFSLLSAYRKHYSTQDVLIRFIEDCKTHIDNDYLVCAILMDLSKAFDCIPHSLIISKFHAYGFSDQTCALIASYLQNRQQRVKIGNHRSQWLCLSKGVPQGSNLGPLIFNIFLNDIFCCITSTSLYNYADDNTLTYFHKNEMILKNEIENDLSNILQWFKSNGMKANPSKFQMISFKKNEKCFDGNICVGNVSLSPEPIVKLLGISIDCKMSFDYHISILCRKAGRQLNALKRLSKSMNKETRFTVYRTFIMSNFDYCACVCHFCGVSNNTKLENIQKRALRFVLNDDTSDYEGLLEKAGSNTLLIFRLRSIAIEVFKCVKKMSPSYLHDMYQSKSIKYEMRDSERLELPYFNTYKFGFRSLKYFGAKLWNSLPIEMKTCVTLSEFKKLIKSWNGFTCNCNHCKRLC